MMKWLADKTLGNWFDYRYDRKLANHNANNDKKVYISKVKFDAEFQMYKDLSNSCFNLALAFSPILPEFETIPQDEEKRKIYYDGIYDNAIKKVQLFQDVLFPYAPFISENIYELLTEIKQLCRSNLLNFKWIHYDKFNTADKVYQDGNQIHSKIQEKHLEFIKTLREYLDSLEVIG